MRQVARSVGGSLRGGTAAVSAYCAGALCGWLLPRPVLQCVMQRTSGTATVALSNVRGPPLELSLRGRQITEIAPFLPPPPGCPIGCALVTLGGKATLSVNADAKLFDAERVDQRPMTTRFRIQGTFGVWERDGSLRVRGREVRSRVC